MSDNAASTRMAEQNNYAPKYKDPSRGVGGAKGPRNLLVPCEQIVRGVLQGKVPEKKLFLINIHKLEFSSCFLLQDGQGQGAAAGAAAGYCLSG